MSESFPFEGRFTLTVLADSSAEAQAKADGLWRHIADAMAQDLSIQDFNHDAFAAATSTAHLLGGVWTDDGSDSDFLIKREDPDGNS